MAISVMYPAMPGSPKTELTADITASATSLTVANGNALPDAPNIVVIGDDENAEVIGYNAKSGNTVSGLVRALGGTVASAWQAGTEVARNFTSFDHDRFKENIEDLATNKANSADVYTQTEIDTLLGGKQNTLTFDSIPTASSTNPVTSGGVKSALETLDNSKVSKSGDTMTGGLTVNNGDVKALRGSVNIGESRSSDWRGFRVTGTKIWGGLINAGNNLTIDQYVNDSSGGDRYTFPSVAAQSSDKWYSILTSKTPVTTAQGGTGGTDSGWQSYTNSSVFTGTIYYRKVGVFFMIQGNIRLANALSTSSYVKLMDIPSAYRPSKDVIPSAMTHASNNIGVRVFAMRIATSGEFYLYTNSADAILTSYPIIFSGFGFM